MSNENNPKHAAEGTNLSLISNGTYDFFKNSATLYLPAIGTLYAAIALIWHLPFSVEVVGTLTAITVFLGTVLKISQKSYNASDAKFDGTLHVDQSDLDDVKLTGLNLNLDSIQDKSALTLKVQNAAVGTPPSV